MYSLLTAQVFHRRWASPRRLAWGWPPVAWDVYLTQAWVAGWLVIQTLEGSFSAGGLADSRLYRSRFLQSKAHFAACVDVYTFDALLQRSTLNAYFKVFRNYSPKAWHFQNLKCCKVFCKIRRFPFFVYLDDIFGICGFSENVKV